jgi:4-hydroxybenzoate polyprenyltransferase
VVDLRRQATPQGTLWLFARSGVLMGSAAASFSATCELVYGGVPAVSFAAAMAFVTVASYSIDRIADELGEGERPRTARALALAAVALFLLGIGVTVAHDSPRAAAAMIVFPLAVAAYSPRVASWVGFMGMKRLIFDKALYVAGVWSLVAAVTAFATPLVHKRTVALMMLYLFLKVYVGATASDLKDEEPDRTQGVKSLPARWGFARTLILVQVLNASTALGVVAAVGAGWLPRFMLFTELHAIIMAVVLTRRYARSQSWVMSEVLNEASASLLLPLSIIGQWFFRSLGW